MRAAFVCPGSKVEGEGGGGEYGKLVRVVNCLECEGGICGHVISILGTLASLMQYGGRLSAH